MAQMSFEEALQTALTTGDWGPLLVPTDQRHFASPPWLRNVGRGVDEGLAGPAPRPGDLTEQDYADLQAQFGAWGTPPAEQQSILADLRAGRIGLDGAQTRGQASSRGGQVQATTEQATDTLAGLSGEDAIALQQYLSGLGEQRNTAVEDQRRYERGLADPTQLEGDPEFAALITGSDNLARGYERAETFAADNEANRRGVGFSGAAIRRAINARNAGAVVRQNAREGAVGMALEGRDRARGTIGAIDTESNRARTDSIGRRGGLAESGANIGFQGSALGASIGPDYSTATANETGNKALNTGSTMSTTSEINSILQGWLNSAIGNANQAGKQVASTIAPGGKAW